METMQPVIAAGTYVWDQALFPQREFEARLRRLQKIAKAQGWAGVIAYGDARSSELLTYITNFAPRIRWSFNHTPPPPAGSRPTRPDEPELPL